jgi:TPR repeat protein
MEMRDQKWFNEAHRRAELGDGDAQLELAWEYMRAENVPKNPARAIALLKQLEATRPEFARFNLAKIKILEMDNTYVDDIFRDCEAGYGPALYLMGLQIAKGFPDLKCRSEALKYYQKAANAGHLPSEFLVWRLSKLGAVRRLVTSLAAIRVLWKIASIRSQDVDDVRILS